MSALNDYITELSQREVAFVIVVAEQVENDGTEAIQLTVETNLQDNPEIGMPILQNVVNNLYGADDE